MKDIKKHTFHKILFLFILVNVSYQAKAFQMIDTVGSYIELKIYSGLEDTVYVNHDRYFGLFVKDSCTVENHGTTIIGNQGCWKRMFTNYSPRFWAIGGQSPDFLVGTVKEEIDAINSAAFAAHSVGGDTITIDSMYLIDRSVFLFTNNTYLGSCDSCGFKRLNPPITVLRDTAQLNDGKIIVENNAGFRSRHKINIVNGQAFDSLAGFASYTAGVSLFLGGDTTIFLSGLNIQKEMLPGDSVSLFFPMMQSRNSSLDSVYIKNLIFDGNSEQYNLNYDWRVSPTILLPTTNISIIEDCRFYRIPNENVFLCGGVFKNCSGADLNGSICHFSCSSFDHPTAVLYNDFSNSNIVGDSIMEHSEAGFTFSAKVQNLRLAYNKINAIGEHGVGIFQNDDSFNEITDNLLFSELETIKFSNLYLYPETNVIYNNKNPNFTDNSAGSCWENTPNLSEAFPCQGNSSLGQPLEIGDTISITIDSILLRKSNENFVKYIIPVYQEEYFTLVNMEINSPDLSTFHSWMFNDISATERGLIFDNGHRNGTFGEGNWGYEGCSDNGKCTEITFYFEVTNLPDFIGMVTCPFQGLKVVYDGQMGSWNYPIYCQNEPVLFDTTLLGNPILQKNLTSSLVDNSDFSPIEVYPNPSQQYIRFKNPLNSVYNYQIINSKGYINQNGKIEENKIFIGHLPDGIYFLNVVGKEENEFIKFSKVN